MKCSNCAHENRTGARFCEEVGTAAAPTGPACPDCRFFLSALTRLAWRRRNVSHGSALRAPGYTPRHLCRETLTEGGAEAAQAGDGTLADVKGSMGLCRPRP
jgi:hypothetical protein